VHPVSTVAADSPTWSKDGRAIYAREGTRIWKIPVRVSGTGVQAGDPAVFCNIDPPRPVPQRNYFVEGADGRLLVLALPTGAEMRTLTLRLNWTSLLPQ